MTDRDLTRDRAAGGEPAIGDGSAASGTDRASGGDSTTGRRGWEDGPTGRAPSTESRGDPEADDLDASAEKGAAAGGLVGLAIGGPLGAGVGAAIGGAAGAAGEAGDSDLDRGFEVVEDDGPGLVDPALDPRADERAERNLENDR